MPSSVLTHRLAGFCGLAGALLFFTGDMLFYGHFGSGSNFHNGLVDTVTHASDARLYAGGLVGPIAACLSIIGFWQLSQNILPPSGFLARSIFILFSVLMVFGSAVHTLWTTRGLAIKYCASSLAPCADLRSSINSYWDIVYNIGAIPGILAAILLFFLILFRKTAYPRWTVLFNPALLIFISPLTEKIPAPLGAIFYGGSANLSIALFFFVSLFTTWNTAPLSPSSRP